VTTMLQRFRYPFYASGGVDLYCFACGVDEGRNFSFLVGSQARRQLVFLNSDLLPISYTARFLPTVPVHITHEEFSLSAG
jgi:hypothetical protein